LFGYRRLGKRSILDVCEHSQGKVDEEYASQTDLATLEELG
jgi:hypothetical protein